MSRRGKAIGKLFDKLWLPLFIVVGTSWLLIPALAHEHYGTLKLISSDEATYSGAIFRIADMCAALLLLLAAWRFHLLRRERVVGIVVIVVAVLAAIDGLFPDTCYIGHDTCSMLDTAVSWVHDAETIVLGAAIAVLSVVDAVRHKRPASTLFVLFQLVAAVLLLAGLVPQHATAVLQYVYETMLIIWLGWFVDGYNASERPVPGRAVRWTVGAWAALSGILALATTFPHVRFVSEAHIWGARSLVGVLLEQHGIVAGVLLLYLARHLLRGERPALWLTVAIVYSQVIKYSLLTPHAVAAVVSITALALLIYARGSFDRHTGEPSWASRLGDVAVVGAGAAAAVLMALVVVTITGERTHFIHQVQHLYDYRYHLQAREPRISERIEARLRVLAETLGVSLVGITLWSLFRPTGKRSSSLERRLGREHMEYLLHKYSNSSEDYFKLWPADKSYFVNGEGAVAYRVEGGIAFMLADAIAPDQRRALVLTEFIRYARRHGWTVCALIIGGKSPRPYEHAGLKKLQIGSSALIDTATFVDKTMRTKWWRWQRNRGDREHLQYACLIPPHDSSVIQELRQVSDAWVGEKGRGEQGFALGYFDETYLQACTLHVLRNAEGRLIAFANELPVFGDTRQATVDLIRYVPGEQGAMPVLLMRTIEQTHQQGCTHFDLGFVPLARVDNDLAGLLRRILTNRFSAGGLEQFKNKFDPEWQPDYLAYDGDILDLARVAANLERVLRVDVKRSGVQ